MAFAEGPDKRACIQAHEQGQISKGSRKLKQAKAQFALCASDTCPPAVREECGKWLSEMGAAIPTIVPAALDMKGQDATAVKVLVDGEALADRLEGKSFEIDPGEHLFRFILADGTTIEQKYVINEGDQRRQIQVDFSKLKPEPAPTQTAPPPVGEPTRTPWAAYVLGGVGVLALGSFATFALLGRSKEDELQKCAPTCADSEVTVMDRRYLAADISLGVGLVTLGVATWMLVTRKPGSGTAPSAWVDVPAVPGGGLVKWTTRF